MLCVTTVLAFGLAVPAFAQTAPAAKSSVGDMSDASENIIVTARRVEERLQDVPISMTVFNQQQLSNRNIVNSRDLAAFTPSLSSNDNFGDQNSSFAIRGFVQDIGTGPSVGVYFADVVAPRGASNNIPIGDGAGPGSFFDLQNVQVLKGPQGTLFGRNTTGGDVLLVPQKPTSKFEGYVEGSYGNYDMKRIQAVLNVPINENVRFRAGVDRQSRDGYEVNDSGVGPGHFMNVDYVAARASLVIDVTPSLENYTIFSYSNSDTNGFIQKVVGCNPTGGLGPFACGQLAQETAKGAGFYTVQNALPNPDVHLRQWQFINTTTWQASDTLTVKNIASYAQLSEFLKSALFGTNFFLAPGLPVDFAVSLPPPGGLTADQNTITEELQFQGRSADNRLTWQAGGYLESSNPLSVVGAKSPVLLSCTNFDTYTCFDFIGAGAINLTTGKDHFRDVGLYSQATYSLTDQLKLTGGFRYTWDHATADSTLITYRLVPPPFGPQTPFCTNVTDSTPAPVCGLHIVEKSSAPTWLIDLDYKPTDSMLLYAKYSRGYRAGGVAPQAPSGYTTFKAEKVDTYEAGMKTAFHGDVRGTFNIAGFYNNFTNQQLQLGFDAKPGQAVSPNSGIVNAGKSRIWGAEVETSIIPFKDFTLDGGYTYLNTKLQSIAQLTTPAA
ncbi:MAG: TonB-dependent receptor, partial [Rhodospirillaceae bacterium]